MTYKNEVPSTHIILDGGVPFDIQKWVNKFSLCNGTSSIALIDCCREVMHGGEFKGYYDSPVNEQLLLKLR